MLSVTNSPFVQGLLSGIAAPIAAFTPNATRTTIDDWVTTPSYRSWEEDRKHIRQDFAKVIGSVSKEISAAENVGRNRR